MNPKSPYFDLAKKYNLKIDFKPFVQVEGISSKDFRHQKIIGIDFQDNNSARTVYRGNLRQVPDKSLNGNGSCKLMR